MLVVLSVADLTVVLLAMVVSLGVGVVCVLGLGVVRFCVEGRAGEVAAVLLLLTVDDGKTVLLVEVLD